MHVSIWDTLYLSYSFISSFEKTSASAVLSLFCRVTKVVFKFLWSDLSSCNVMFESLEPSSSRGFELYIYAYVIAMYYLSLDTKTPFGTDRPKFLTRSIEFDNNFSKWSLMITKITMKVHILGHFRSTYRAVDSFLNPGGLAVVWGAKSAPLVRIWLIWYFIKSL